MKRTASERKRSSEDQGLERRQRSVCWDEANLEGNEKIKAELNPRKINEPKTPYHGPQDSDDDEGGGPSMSPLTLEDDEAVRQLAAERKQGSSVPSWRDDDRAHSHQGWSDSERGGSREPSSGREQSSGGGPAKSHTTDTSHSSVGQGGQGDECESNPEAHRKHQEKRRKFEARRRQHYKMRDALKKGKELLSHEGLDKNPLNGTHAAALSTSNGEGL